MKFWVTLAGRDAEVEFHAVGEHVVVEVEGRRIEADFRRLPDGEVYSLLINGHSHEVRVAPVAGQLEVMLESTTIPVEVRHPLEKLLQSSRRAVAGGGGETVLAPMPGLVVALRVKPGETVAAGQPVAIVEATKMQNELVARHGGVVSEVLVAERASVSAGQPMIRIRAAVS
jgi:biotin carboxyl carrier protein